jgi:hypothetical protein
MRTVSTYASAIVTAAMLASGIGASAQDSKLSVPDLSVTAPPFVGTRSPYFGRYRVEENKFSEVPCSQTRIAFGPNGKCLQGIGWVFRQIPDIAAAVLVTWRST